jgi:hypothetical protein
VVIKRGLLLFSSLPFPFPLSIFSYRPPVCVPSLRLLTGVDF